MVGSSQSGQSVPLEMPRLQTAHTTLSCRLANELNLDAIQSKAQCFRMPYILTCRKIKWFESPEQG